MTHPQSHVEPLDGLVDATNRMVRTVDSLTDDALAEPSALPGWSRAHVVAHLALNAEAFIEVLRGIKEGEDVPMYRSQEARTDDIEELVGDSAAQLRERFLAGTALFQEAVVAVPDPKWDERPLACVVVRPEAKVTPEDLREFLSSHVARWQLPERWAFIEAVPKTSVGKFDKKVLRKQYAEEQLAVTTLDAPPSG